MSQAAYTNLSKPKNTKSGIAEWVWLAFIDDFATINKPPATGTKEDRYTIATAHVFKDVANKFMKFRLLPGKNGLSMKTSGDAGAQRAATSVNIFIPGSYIEAHSTVSDMINQALMAIVKDAECSANQYYQIGGDCAGAYLTVDFTTGTTVDGVKGYTGTIDCQDNFLYYNIVDGPATLADGESTPVDPVDPPAGG